MLRANLRDLRTEAGEHYADILLSLYQHQLKELHEAQEADQAEAEVVKEAAQASKSDQQAGQVNGHEVSHETVQRMGGIGNSKGQNGTGTMGQVDKSALLISAPRRIRDKDHLRFVASQPCLVCSRSPGHAHHIRFAQSRAMGRKVSDEWTVPLCASHHRSFHAADDEQYWWKARGIDTIPHAEQLWRARRGEGLQQSGRARELISPGPS